MDSTSHEVSSLLHSRPGTWARVRSYSSFNSVHGRAKSIRQGLVKAFSPAGSYETAVRRVSDEEFLLFARYAGKDKIALGAEVRTPDEFRFVESLPEPGSRVIEREYQTIAGRLRAIPGETHVLQGGLSIRQAQRLASRVRSGSFAAFRPAGEFDATPVKETGGLWSVRVRTTKLIVPAFPGKKTSERSAGWLEGVAWYQEHANENRTVLQREVDRHVRDIEGTGKSA